MRCVQLLLKNDVKKQSGCGAHNGQELSLSAARLTGKECSGRGTYSPSKKKATMVSKTGNQFPIAREQFTFCLKTGSFLKLYRGH